MMRRHHTTGIGQEHPALSVRFPNDGCRQRPAVYDNVIGDFDMLSCQRRDGLDQRGKATITKPAAKISAPLRLAEDGRHRRADKHQIADRDCALELFDAPEPEWFARRQVQPISTHSRCH